MSIALPFTPAELAAHLCTLRPALTIEAERHLLPDDAEDAVADVGCMALVALAAYDPTTGATGLTRWLFGILRNAIRQRHFQLAHAREEFYPSDSPPDIPDHTAEETADRERFYAELHERLRRAALTSLQDSCVRRWLAGETQAAIGEDLGISQRMVAYHIEAAARHLRELPAFEIEIADGYWELFWEHAKVAIYRRPQGVWKSWAMSHPPKVTLSRLRRVEKAERKRTRREMAKSALQARGRL